MIVSPPSTRTACSGQCAEKVSFEEGQAVWLQIMPRASAQEILDAAAAVYEGMTEQEIDEFEKKFLRRGDFFRPNPQK